MQQARRHARSDVVDKATALLDDYGIADLTMRRLARELNVTPGALYWHFCDKQELLGAVADRILDPTTTMSDPVPWDDRIKMICSALRNALLSTTDGAELVSASFAAGKSDRIAEILRRLTAAAAEAGMAAPNDDLTARTLLYYVLGFTADEQSRLQWDAAGSLSGVQSVLATNSDGHFAFGLGLLIGGMSAHHLGDQGVDPGVAVPTA